MTGKSSRLEVGLAGSTVCLVQVSVQEVLLVSTSSFLCTYISVNLDGKPLHVLCALLVLSF